MTDSKINISAEIPAVWHLRIPTENCEDGAHRYFPCKSVMIGVDDGKVQAALWPFDINHDHILGPEDVVADPDLNPAFIGANNFPTSAWKIAKLFTEVEWWVDGHSFFSKPKDVLIFAKTVSAVDDAYKAVIWLQGLPSQKDKSLKMEMIEKTWHVTLFSAADWSRIVARLQPDPIKYAMQMFDTMVMNIDELDGCRKAAYAGKERQKEENADLYYRLTPKYLPYSIAQQLVDMGLKIAAINEFTSSVRAIGCHGKRCRSDAFSPSSLKWGNNSGVSILLRIPPVAPYEPEEFQTFEGNKLMQLYHDRIITEPCTPSVMVL